MHPRMSDDVTENEGGFDRNARTGGIGVDASAAATSSSNANVHLIQNQTDDDFNDESDDETDARGQPRRRRRVLKDATASSVYGLRREGTTASLWAAMKLRDDNHDDAFAAVTTTKRGDASSDVDLYATKCALYRSHVESSRAIARGALLRWKLACGPRVSAARMADAAVRARERRAARRAFDRWCAQTPGVSKRRRRRRQHFNHHGRGMSFGGEGDDDDGGLTPVDFLNDDEFPTDYRDELEIRLKQIARLEDALREANAREARAASGEAFEEEMRKFRSHLTNLQRELENVKRERDAYKKKWTESSGPAALKSLEERRANQRTMATQTTFDDDDDDSREEEKAAAIAKEKAAAIANATPATKSEIRAAEKKWMDQARLFQQKFERQMEITSDFERKLREERTRLLRSETRYEARIQEMATKHAEEIIEMRSRRVEEEEEEDDDARPTDREDELTYASPASLDNDRFAEYAKIGAARGRADERNDDDSEAYKSGRSRSSSPAVEETFITPVGVRGSDVASEHPERFETASKRLHFASLDDFSSSSEDEYNRGADDDDEMHRRGVPQPPPPVSAGATRKPIRLTVAVAKLVMMGHSQRDAIDALKRVDGNDVQAADAWLKTRT